MVEKKDVPVIVRLELSLYRLIFSIAHKYDWSFAHTLRNLIALGIVSYLKMHKLHSEDLKAQLSSALKEVSGDE